MSGSKPRQVTLPDGTVFPSINACARHFNVTKATIQSRIKRGTLTASEFSPVNLRAHISRPYVIAHLTFPSLTIGATALGYKPGYLQHVRRYGSTAALRLLAHRITEYSKNQEPD